MFATLEKTYRGKRVFVTGHTGFKGAWLSFWLAEMGADVYGYALEEPGAPATFTAIDLGKHLKADTRADLADLAALRKAFAAANPDIVFHMAAQPLVRLSYREPLETLQTNFMGTAHVLDVLRTSSKKVPCIVITSDKCYENREIDYGYQEHDPMGGSDIYSMSKGACELLTTAYRKSFQLPLASGRAGNVIGGGDYAEDRIIPDCVRALAAGKPVVLRNPGSIRPWQHVLEPVSGYLVLGEKLLSQGADAFYDGWNFGPKEEKVDVETLAGHFLKTWSNEGGSGKLEIDRTTQHPHEAKLLRLNIEKAGRELNWRPTWSVSQTIHETAHWYREFESKKREKGSMLETTRAQIKKYVSQAR